MPRTRKPKQFTLWDAFYDASASPPPLRERLIQREGLSTGFPQLDSLLHFGGIPRGRITEIVGELSSGCTSLAAYIIATAQLQAGWVSYFRLGSGLDPMYGVYCGVQHKMLLTIQLDNPFQVFDAVRDVMRIATSSLVVVDLMDVPVTLSNNLNWPEEGASTVVVLRSKRINDTLAQSAWTRLYLKRWAWLYEDEDIIGVRSRVRVQKNKPAQARQYIDLDFVYREFEAQQ